MVLPMRTIAPPMSDLSSRKVALTRLLPANTETCPSSSCPFLIFQRACRHYLGIGDRQTPVHLQPVLLKNFCQRSQPLVPDQNRQEISHLVARSRRGR